MHYMKVIPAPSVSTEPRLCPEHVELKSIGSGKGFRLFNDVRPEEEVIKSGEVFMVLEAPELPKDERASVKFVALDTGKSMVRDGSTWVIPHDIEHVVYPSKKVPVTE